MKKIISKKISIITVVKNDEKNIIKTINSIKNQSYKNIQYIVIDGKSNDDTLKILKKNKKNIDIIISENDKGLYDAMNKGLKLCTGDIVGIINSGDIYYKNTLKYVNYYFAKNKSIDFLFGSVKKHWGILKGYKPWKIFFTWFFYTSHSTGFFLTRNAAKKIGPYNLKYKYSSDFDYFYRMIVKNKFKGMAAKENIIFGFFRPGGISSRLGYWEHFYEKFIIRKDNKQNKFFILLLIFVKILRDYKMLKKLELKKFKKFLNYILK
tara:strand:- start:88 stop:882 length:795 start_codon:yes stop_codon:yes gene_type:complete